MTQKKLRIGIGIGVAAAAIVLLCAAYVRFMEGDASRSMVRVAIMQAAPVRDSVMAFRVAQGRWPRDAEAGPFRIDPSQLQDARSLAYDPKEKAVVVTMKSAPIEGKRFAFYGEDQGGAPRWACRPIDIETRYLPASCRR